MGGSTELGRSFRPDDVGRDVAVISHRFWRDVLQQDPDVIGRSLAPHWNSRPARAEIIGVAQPGFSTRSHPWDDAWHDVDVWMLEDPSRYSPFYRFSVVLGRLGPGRAVTDAQAELDTIAARMEAQDSRYQVQPYMQIVRPLQDHVNRDRKELLTVLAGAAGLVLLIACANVSGLFLGHASSRSREMAGRAALGAGRARLLRQLLVESVLIACLGGALGVALAYFGVGALGRLMPAVYGGELASSGFADNIGIDDRVLAFALATSVLTGVLFGLLPALRTSGSSPADVLKGGTQATGDRRGRNAQKALVVVQVAIAVVLVLGAALTAGSLLRLIRLDPGFDPENLLSVQVDLAGPKYRKNSRASDAETGGNPLQAARAFHEEALRAVRAVPGVLSAAYTDHLPTTGDGGVRVTLGHERPEPGDEGRLVRRLSVSQDYFQTMRIPLVQGRRFSLQDSPGAPPVAVLNMRAAEELFPGEDPLGKHLWVHLLDLDSLESVGYRPAIEIVGVVGDVAQERNRRRAQRPTVYLPYWQDTTELERYGFAPVFTVRTQSDPMRYVDPVRNALTSIDPEQTPFEFRSMRDRLAGTVDDERFWLSLLGAFGAISLFLAAIGLYGIVSYACSQRINEFGVRMALGARPAKIAELAIKEGLLLVAAGVLIGFGVSFGLTRFIRNQLYGVEPNDPVTVAVVVLVLLIASSLAAFAPARRAAGLDPVVALRQE